MKIIKNHLNLEKAKEIKNKIRNIPEINLDADIIYKTDDSFELKIVSRYNRHPTKECKFYKEEVKKIFTELFDICQEYYCSLIFYKCDKPYVFITITIN
jgi:regulator of replication initiation timing